MASIEIDAATATMYFDTREGRRVLVLTALGSADEVVLPLPLREPARTLRRLEQELGIIAKAVDALPHVDGPGIVIIAPFPGGHGGPMSGAG